MHKSKITIRSIIKYACFILLVGYLVKSYYSFERVAESQVNNFVSYPKITNTYSNLFPKQAFELLQPSYTFFNKLKNPIATYEVMDGMFRLMVYRMEIRTDLPINQIVKVNWNGDQPISLNTTYNISIQNHYITFGDANSKTDPISCLYLNINAVILNKPIFTDSVISFSLGLNKFIARSQPKGDVLFFAEKKATMFFKKAPVELLFLKKNKDLYMLLMTPMNGKEMPPINHIVYKLLNNIHTTSTLNRTYINRKSDLDDATNITNKFYFHAKNKDYSQTYPLFNMEKRGFKKSEGNEKLNQLFHNIQYDMGTIESIKLLSGESKRVEGDNPRGEYKLVYDILRSKGNSSREEFRLVLEGKQIKIAGYDVNPN